MVIPLRDQEFLRQRFQDELVGEVKIEHFTQRDLGLFVPGRQPCPTCKPTRQMMEELAALSGKIKLRVYEFAQEAEAAARWGVDRIPATVLHTANGRHVKHFGMPSGHEFVAFIEGIVDLSRGNVFLSKEATKRLGRLKKDVHVQVFVTPACPYCPHMVRIVQQMAIQTAHVKAEVVEVGEFPQLAERFNVRSVPTTVIDGRFTVVGAAPDLSVAEQLVRAAEAPLAPPLSSQGGPATLVQPAPSPRGSGGLILP